MWRRILITAIVFAAGTSVTAQLASAAEIFVAPNGVPTGSGTIDHPVNLATALSANSPASPGDTIWLRGGTYIGVYTSYLRGAQGAPITVRQYPGERATLDGAGDPRDILTVYGQWVIFWGLEITNSDPRRLSTQPGPWPNDIHRGAGVTAWGPNLKFINLVFHDLSAGMGLWKESVDTEVYGCLFYYNGWQGPDGSHGHGIYTQNLSGTRLIRENIAFSQFSHGIHAYGSSAAFLNNITFEGNVAFNNGDLGSSGFERDFLLGGGVLAQNPVLRENYTYGGAQSNLGYGAGCVNGTVIDNYFVGSTPLILVACSPVMTGNLFYNLQAAQWGWGASNFRPQDYPDNVYDARPPAANFIKVRPNIYEAGRGNVIVYNWLHQGQVQVDLAPVGLSPGDQFEVRDAQNFFGVPVITGVYDGTPVTLPMYGLTLDPPIGDVPVLPAHTAPEFGVFVVLRTNGVAPVPPVPVATPTVSPAGGTFTAPVTVSLASTTAGAAIRYTVDGSMPTTASSLYAGPFVVSVTTTIQARAFAATMLDSAVTTALFTVVPPARVAAPTIGPAGGAFTAPVPVLLASSTLGAVIRYTTDGSVPTTASSLYAGPFVVSVTSTVQARAYAATMLDSAVTTALFTVVPPVGPPPPQISGVAILSVTTFSATLTWTTDQAADSEVDYGPTASYGTSTPVDPLLVTTHRETLSGLSAGTTYHFRVGSWNAQGVLVMSGDFVFTTASGRPLSALGDSAGPPPPPIPPPAPPASGGNGCATPDPFVVLGGGICSQGGWRPPVVPAPIPSGGGSGGCTTPDPFSALGGGVCVGDGWRLPPTVVTPPPTALTGGSTGCMTPDPFVALGGGICANGGWRPPAYAIGLSSSGGSSSCTSPDPFVTLGGGTCVNGGWRPPTMVFITGAGTSVPVVNPALCKTPDPFASIPGLVGACINGGWVPVIKVGG